MATGIVTVTIAEAAAAQADPGTTSLVILDTSANIAAGLDSLPGLTKLGSIRTADPGFVVAGYTWFAANPATVGLFAARVLDIHDVPASQTLAPQGSAKVSSFSVADTAAQVAKYFSTLNQRTRMDGITVTDGKPIVLTATQFASYTYARARVVSGFGFTVTGATVAAAAGLEADTAVASFTIADTASRITAAIGDLPAMTRLTSIKVSGTGTVAVSYAWFVANPATLALFSTRVVDVHDVPAGLTLAVQGNAHVVNFTVTDTAAEIGSHFSALNQRTRLDGITVSDSAPIALTATQFATYTYARSVITAGTRFTVASAAVAVAAGLQADTTVSGFTVADTSANVTAGLDTLGGLTRMTAIRLTDTGTVTAPYSWFATHTAIANLLTTRDLDVHDVPAAQGALPEAHAKVLHFSVADTAAAVGANFAALDLFTRLDGIAVTDGKPVPLAAAVFAITTNARSHVVPGTVFAIAAAAAADATTLDADALVASFAVTGTGADILAGIEGLAAAIKLGAITLTDGSMLSLTLAQLDAHAAAFATLGGKLSLRVSDATAARVADLQALAYVKAYTVADTAANIAASFAALNTAASSKKLVGIDASDDNQVRLANAVYRTTTYARKALTGGTQLFVTDVAASQATAADADALVAGFTVRDSATNVTARLPELSAAAASSLTLITLTSNVQLNLSGDVYAANTAGLAKLADGSKIFVTGSTMANVPAMVADPHVTLFTIADTHENVHIHFDDFQFTSKLVMIDMTDPPPITVDIADFDLHRYAFNHFAGNDLMTVTDVPVNRVPELAQNNHIISVTVRDTLAQIHENLDYLHTQEHEGFITGVEVSDTGGTLYLTPWEASTFDNLVSIITGSFTTVVTDTPPPEVLPRLFNLVWEDSAAGAPAGFVQAVQYAADFLDTIITTRTAINVRIGYGEVLDQPLGPSVLAATYVEQGTTATYDKFRIAYEQHIRSDIAQSVFDTMVAPADGRTIYVGGGQAEALGLSPATVGHVDAEIGFAQDPAGTYFTYDPDMRAVSGKYDFISVAIHELAHALGRLSYGAGATTGLDMLRFASPGVRAEAGSASYFSTDGGTTHLVDFALKGNGDWATSAGNDTFSVSANPGIKYNFTETDLKLLEALGYTVSPDGIPATTALTVNPSRGLAAPSLAFIGTPDVVTMDGVDTDVAFAMQPGAGILRLDNFVNGRDTLTLDLTGMTDDLVMYDLQVDDRFAIALVDGDQRSFGVLLTDRAPGETAADLLLNHYSRTGNTALIF